MKSKIVSIGGKTVNGILILFLAFTLYFVISSKINGGEPRVFGKELMVVLSGSMSPVFETGALIAVDPTGFSKTYLPGDIITYRSPEDVSKIVTHRILEVKHNNGRITYVTKGDANDTADLKPVPATSVIGQYSGFQIPVLGYILDFTKSPIGIACFLILSGILLIGKELVSLFRMFSKVEKERSAT